MKKLIALFLAAMLLVTIAASALAGPGQVAYCFRLGMVDKDYNLIGEYSSNTAYIGDITNGVFLVPMFRVNNLSDRSVTANIKMVIDDEIFTWDPQTIKYGRFYSACMTRTTSRFRSNGTHTYKCYSDDVLKASGNYTIKSGKSASRDTAPNFLAADYIYWEKKDDSLAVSFRLQNKGSLKTASSVELYVFAKDKWGNDIYGGTIYYSVTDDRRWKPGQSNTSRTMLLPNRSEIRTIYCGIHKVVYTDGSSFEDPDDGGMIYYDFTYN